MRYENIYPGVFLERPNRFIARVLLDGREETCHVKNTGRCKELLLPGAEIWLNRPDSAVRKTKYDLVAVRKGDRLVNIDSSAPNRLCLEWFRTGGGFSGASRIRSEVTYGGSRLDFRVEWKNKIHYIEVKGVTLEEDGIARFPDAPSLRGLRHVRELIKAAGEGCGAVIIFIIQMERVKCFTPNWQTQPEFGFALQEAAAAGVEIWSWECKVRPEEIMVNRPVPMLLDWPGHRSDRRSEGRVQEEETQ